MTQATGNMKAGKITAKLRDAVQVSFMVGADEMARYRNIEIPDALKEIPITHFGFYILGDGKIEFQLHFAEGTLPKEFPAKRERQARKPKDASQALKPTEATPAIIATATAKKAPDTEASPEPKEAPAAQYPAMIPEKTASDTSSTSGKDGNPSGNKPEKEGKPTKAHAAPTQRTTGSMAAKPKA